LASSIASWKVNDPRLNQPDDRTKVVPWTEAETNDLIRGYNEFGPKWTKIMKKYDSLALLDYHGGVASKISHMLKLNDPRLNQNDQKKEAVPWREEVKTNDLIRGYNEFGTTVSKLIKKSNSLAVIGRLRAKYKLSYMLKVNDPQLNQRDEKKKVPGTDEEIELGNI
jgi:hypothetical protein